MFMVEGVEIRRATKDEALAFYGRLPEKEIIAWAAIYRGEIACIAGYRKDDGGNVAFCDVKEGINAPKMKIYRAAREMLKEMVNSGVHLITIVKRAEGERGLIESLGFVPNGNKIDGFSVYELKEMR